jgi:hypothetical protein
MKQIILMAFLVLAACIPAYAFSPVYDSSRKWVEQYCATNTPSLVRNIPEDQRIFVEDADSWSGRIVAYHQGMTLKDVGITNAMVQIMHLPNPLGSFTYTSHPLIAVKDNLDLKIEDMDVIFATSYGTL